VQLAEPIFLHIVRPVLKPYAPTIDFVLEHTASIGDFIALLISIPVEIFASYLPKSWHANEEEINSRESAFLGEFETNRIQPEPRESYSGMPQSNTPYPVWQPSSLPPNDKNVASSSFATIYQGPPTPPLERQTASAHTRNASDEWKPYPNYPSAFVPMPVPSPAPTGFPSSMADPRPHSTSDNEDEAGYDVQPSAFPWPTSIPGDSTLPPGFRPSVQQ
jgi:hypothetical protein